MRVVSEFIHIDVEPGPASPDGVTLRFKRVAGSAERELRDVRYESEAGLDGQWSVVATDDPDGRATHPARALLVEDSSDGSAWLIVGGVQGLVLDHEATGTRVREPYLVLTKTAL
jgi:hypothetical protein